MYLYTLMKPPISLIAPVTFLLLCTCDMSTAVHCLSFCPTASDYRVTEFGVFKPFVCSFCCLHRQFSTKYTLTLLSNKKIIINSFFYFHLQIPLVTNERLYFIYWQFFGFRSREQCLSNIYNENTFVSKNSLIRKLMLNHINGTWIYSSICGLPQTFIDHR